MWKEYTKSCIKNNRTASIFIMITVFTASVFICAVCSTFYNMWTDGIQRTVDKEGGWHGRITDADGSISPEQLRVMGQRTNTAGITVEENGNGIRTICVCLKNPRTIYRELPEMMRQAGLDGKEGVSAEYHSTLLTQYYIYSEEEKKDPPLLLTYYIVVMALVCISLVLIIYSAFAITMGGRLHQLGILQSAGATPRQIRTALMQEACVLSLLPVLAGTGAGAALTYMFIQFGNAIGDIAMQRNAVFRCHPAILIISVAGCLGTVFLAAWKAARKLSRISPLDAVRNFQEQPVDKVRKFRLLTVLFGIEGELAGKSLYTRRKSYRTAALSLTISFLVLGVFMNFMTLSDMGTQQSYFMRYKDKWDLMVTVKGTEDVDMLERLRAVPGTEGCTRYQKFQACTYVPDSAISAGLKAAGGLDALNDTGIRRENGMYTVPVPLIVMDDESYQDYCGKAGVDDTLYDMPASVTVNRIWDNIHSDFRDRQFLPFIDEQEIRSLALHPENAGGGTGDTSVRITGYTDRVPDLREEYGYFSLLQIMSATSYKSLRDKAGSMNGIGGNTSGSSFPGSPETFYRILASSDEGIDRMEEDLTRLMDSSGLDYVLENRKSAETYNIMARNGLNKIMSAFCGMLAFVGIANVFANTLGQIAQRKREFARYLSIGLTPGGLKKILLAEALVVSLKPILIILPLNVLFVIFSVYAKYDGFIRIMPVMPFVLMGGLVLSSVGTAYYLAGRMILRANIVEALKDDTMI